MSGGETPEQIADSINRSMVWGYTPQGTAFWDAVYWELKNLQHVLNGGNYVPSQSYEALLQQGIAAKPKSVAAGNGGIRAAVSQGSSHRCIDCSLMRCSAPGTRCVECDRNIKAGKQA